MTHNRSTTILCALLLVTGLTMALAPEAHADRRSSLGGNLLIEDADDVFVFPHTALKHVRLMTMDLAPGGAGAGTANASGVVGSAGLIVGDETFAVGVFTHRSDFINNLPVAFSSFGDIDALTLTNGGAVGNPGLWTPQGGLADQGNFLQPLQWIDAVIAFDMGGSPLGIRLSIGHARDNSEATNGDNTNIETNTATSVNALIGYGLGGDLNLDLSAEISFGLLEDTSDPDGDAISQSTSSNLPTLSLMARGKKNLAKGVDLGILGLIDVRSLTTETTIKPGDTKSGASAFTFGAEVGAGPIYHIEDKFTIAAYATLGIRSLSIDPQTNADSKNDEQSVLTITLPQLRLSGEFYVTEWLILRTGAQFTYAFALGEENQGEDAVTNTTNSGNFFRWISGVGIDLGDLDLNATLNHDFLFNGPNFIGGGEGMSAMLNISYDFN